MKSTTSQKQVNLGISLKDIQALISDMYKQNKISEIQERSAKVYKYCKSKGLSHDEAVNQILSHGVKLEDLQSGILTLGIEFGVEF